MHKETLISENRQQEQLKCEENQDVNSLPLEKNDRKELEAKVVAKMIQIYCKGNHRVEGKSDDVVGRKRHRTSSKVEHVCDECAELLEYARQRIEKCSYSKNKPFCSKCKIHCYGADMRERIRAVMRYSGPRMILHCPNMAIKHLLDRVKK